MAIQGRHRSGTMDFFALLASGQQNAAVGTKSQANALTSTVDGLSKNGNSSTTTRIVESDRIMRTCIYRDDAGQFVVMIAKERSKKNRTETEEDPFQLETTEYLSSIGPQPVSSISLL